jgi:hypothetical protein
MASAFTSGRTRRPVTARHRLLTPVPAASERLQSRDPADEPDVTTLPDDLELGPARYLQVLAELLGNRQSAAVVDLGGPVVLAGLRPVVGRAHAVTVWS